MTIKSAKQALLAVKPEQLNAIDNGYSGSWINSDYGNVCQRWLLVHSEQTTKREEINFFKNLEKNIAKEIKALDKLSKKPFACKVDVLSAFEEFKKQCHLLGFEHNIVLKVPTYSSRA